MVILCKVNGYRAEYALNVPTFIYYNVEKSCMVKLGKADRKSEVNNGC